MREVSGIKNDVRERREAKGFTQAELAVRTGVSRQAINAIETGKYDPSIGLAHALAKVFGCAIEDIFFFEDGGKDEKE